MRIAAGVLKRAIEVAKGAECGRYGLHMQIRMARGDARAEASAGGKPVDGGRTDWSERRRYVMTRRFEFTGMLVRSRHDYNASPCLLTSMTSQHDNLVILAGGLRLQLGLLGGAYGSIQQGMNAQQ